MRELEGWVCVWEREREREREWERWFAEKVKTPNAQITTWWLIQCGIRIYVPTYIPFRPFQNDAKLTRIGSRNSIILRDRWNEVIDTYLLNGTCADKRGFIKPVSGQSLFTEFGLNDLTLFHLPILAKVKFGQNEVFSTTLLVVYSFICCNLFSKSDRI